MHRREDAAAHQAGIVAEPQHRFAMRAGDAGERSVGQRAGVSREALWRVIEASPVASPLLKAKAPALRRHDYSPTFSVGQMRKDLALILDQAAALGIELPLAADTDAALAAAEQGGDAAADYAVIVRTAERRAGLDFPSLPPGVIP